MKFVALEVIVAAFIYLLGMYIYLWAANARTKG